MVITSTLEGVNIDFILSTSHPFLFFSCFLVYLSPSVAPALFRSLSCCPCNNDSNSYRISLFSDGDEDKALEGRMQTIVRWQIIKNKTPVGKAEVVVGSAGEKEAKRHTWPRIGRARFCGIDCERRVGKRRTLGGEMEKWSTQHGR